MLNGEWLMAAIFFPDISGAKKQVEYSWRLYCCGYYSDPCPLDRPGKGETRSCLAVVHHP